MPMPSLAAGTEAARYSFTVESIDVGVAESVW